MTPIRTLALTLLNAALLVSPLFSQPVPADSLPLDWGANNPAIEGAGIPRRLIAIDNVCAWPNLTLLKNGKIIAAVHNQPNHGMTPCDIDCWESDDQGLTWKFLSTATRHEPETARFNHGFGQNASGDLIVLCSGWDNIKPLRNSASRPLPTTVSISRDGGRTWDISKNFPGMVVGLSNHVPFGDISLAANGDLVAGTYAFDAGPAENRAPGARRRGDVYTVRSKDGGKTWPVVVPVVQDTHVEAALVHLGNGRWVTASRRFGWTDLEVHVSDDDAMTWRAVTVLGTSAVSAAHLLKLSDGRLLLTYGTRVPRACGIDARISKDGGLTWGQPQRLISLDQKDNGYTDAVELSGGRILISYYTSGSREHRRYHMGVLNVALDELK